MQDQETKKTIQMFEELTNTKLTEEGNNPVEDLLANLKRSTSLEMGVFAVELLKNETEKFIEQYSNPAFPEFRESMKAIIERYQVMSSDERLNLFKKLEILFKDVFMPFTQIAGPRAEEIAVSYSTQMSEIIKQASNIAAQENGIPKIDFTKV